MKPDLFPPRHHHKTPAGAQWEKAGEVFEAMQAQGCRPDVVTYTALIQAYERGGQWRRALAVSVWLGLGVARKQLGVLEARCKACAGMPKRVLY